jgi:hypothetical protein
VRRAIVCEVSDGPSKGVGPEQPEPLWVLPEMYDYKKIIAVRPASGGGDELVALVVFHDGGWTFWRVDDPAELNTLMGMVGATVQIHETFTPESGPPTIH